MIWALIVYAIAQVADILTTKSALDRGAREANPIVARMMGTFGKRWWIAKIAVSGSAAAFAVYADEPKAIWLVAAITAFVAYRNDTASRAR